MDKEKFSQKYMEKHRHALPTAGALVQARHKLTKECYDYFVGRIYIAAKNGRFLDRGLEATFGVVKRTLQKRMEYARKIDGQPLTVKDAPAQDADTGAYILAYTIPSWTSIINNALLIYELENISLTAQRKLTKELADLAQTAEIAISWIGGAEYD